MLYGLKKIKQVALFKNNNYTVKGKIAICIVEDLKDIRDRVIRTIEGSDEFKCLGSYGTAEEALKELPGLMPDIVLMDINLPGMSGIECIRQIKRKCPKIQFMMFTIYEDNEQVFEALAAGATGYLLKKMPYGKILESLKELYNGGAPMSTQIARKVVAAFQTPIAADNDAASCLSKRETEVVQLLSKGFLYKEIADKLYISTGTVRQHIHKIYEKLHVQNRTEALNKYFGRSQSPP